MRPRLIDVIMLELMTPVCTPTIARNWKPVNPVCVCVCMCVCVGVGVCPCLLYIKSPLYINSGSCDTSILLYTYLWREIYLFGTFSNNVQYPRNTRCDLFVFQVVGTVTKCVFYYTLKALNGSFEHSIQFKVYLL